MLGDAVLVALAARKKGRRLEKASGKGDPVAQEGK
jgi:hypothetical protein